MARPENRKGLLKCPDYLRGLLDKYYQNKLSSDESSDLAWKLNSWGGVRNLDYIPPSKSSDSGTTATNSPKNQSPKKSS